MIPEPDYSDDAETEQEEEEESEGQSEEKSSGDDTKTSDSDATDASSKTSDTTSTDRSSKSTDTTSTDRSSKTSDTTSTDRSSKSTDSDDTEGSSESITKKASKSNVSSRNHFDHPRSFLTTKSNGKVRGSTSKNFSSANEPVEERLVQPKKPSNPYLEDAERQRLHKELKFQQKHGQSVAKKSELQVAMDKYKEKKLKKGLASQRTSLEKILEKQAKKIEMQENKPEVGTPDWMHQLREQRERWSDPRTDEFYRVHARVVSSGYSSDTSESGGKEKKDAGSSSF